MSIIARRASSDLSHSVFVPRIKKDLVRLVGWDPALYAGHSLRRGGRATFAFSKAHLHPLLINKALLLGDWLSNAFMRYCCEEAQTGMRLADAQALATATLAEHARRRAAAAAALSYLCCKPLQCKRSSFTCHACNRPLLLAPRAVRRVCEQLRLLRPLFICSRSGPSSPCAK
jgi:hypothetical protein